MAGCGSGAVYRPQCRVQGALQARCRLKAMETEMSTASWRSNSLRAQPFGTLPYL